MTRLINDTQNNEYIIIDAPNYVVNNKLEQYRKLKATRKNFNLTLWQFLVAEEYENMNPDNIHTAKPSEVQAI